MYSKEDIERKRLQALAIKQKKYGNFNNATKSPGVPATNKNMCSNENNFPSTSKSSLFSKSESNKNLGVFKQQFQQNRFNPMKAKNFHRNNDQLVIGNCYMVQNDRFAVDLSKYHPPVIDVFRTIPSKAYDLQTRIWNFHLSDYDMLLEKLMRRSDITVHGLPKFIKEIFDRIKNEKDENQMDISPIDENLRELLMPFQKEGICFGISKKGRCIIADDMGLGKTIQALGIAHYYKQHWPLLIVTPSSVRYQWSEAIFKFLPSVPVQHVHHFRKLRNGFESGKITIVSYDLLARSINDFEQQIFGVVIFDESHFLKSSKTERHKAAQRIAAQASKVILLSGTPVLSRPIELFSQIKLIIPNFMGITEYGIRYCAGAKRSFGWDFNGSSNLHELELLLKACCLIRRMKSDVLSQLPAKLRQVVMLDPFLIEAGTKEMEEMAQKLQKETLTGAKRHSALLQYYSESSSAKRKAICNYIADLLENREKFLVYAHHQGVMDAICDVITSKKIKYIRIDGRTNPEQRKQFVDMFQEKKEILVAVLSITAANAGITLTAAQLVVFAELTWNPGVLCQAEDRVHRIGQHSSVVVQYLIAKNTVDDYLWPKIQHKLGVLNKVGLDQEFAVNADDVSVQKSVNNEKTRMDEYVTCSSLVKSNGVTPKIKLYTSKPSTSSSRGVQSSIDSFIPRSVNFLEADGSTKEEKKGTLNPRKTEHSFGELLDNDDEFNYIDFDDFV